MRACLELALTLCSFPVTAVGWQRRLAGQSCVFATLALEWQSNLTCRTLPARCENFKQLELFFHRDIDTSHTPHHEKRLLKQRAFSRASRGHHEKPVHAPVSPHPTAHDPPLVFCARISSSGAQPIANSNHGPLRIRRGQPPSRCPWCRSRCPCQEQASRRCNAPGHDSSTFHSHWLRPDGRRSRTHSSTFPDEPA